LPKAAASAANAITGGVAKAFRSSRRLMEGALPAGSAAATAPGSRRTRDTLGDVRPEPLETP